MQQIDILKLLDISFPSLSVNDIFNLSITPFTSFYIEYSLAQSKRYHQIMSLLRYPVYNTSQGLPLNMLSVVDSLLILNENIFFTISVSI